MEKEMEAKRRKRWWCSMCFSQTGTVSLHGINRSVFVTERCCVSCELRTEFLCIIWKKYRGVILCFIYVLFIIVKWKKYRMVSIGHKCPYLDAVWVCV
jgi:hypothetical protein